MAPPHIPAECKRYDIRLTFHTDIASRPLDGVYFFAKQVAFSYDFGSGARIGDGVQYLSGGCFLYGMADNWVSVVQSGSVVMIYDVPETLIQHTAPVAGVYYEFFERLPNAS